MPCNEADIVNSARLDGKKMAIRIKNRNRKIREVIVLKES